MADFAWSDLFVLWPLLIGTHLGALAYGYQVGWRHGTQASAGVIKTQRKEIEASHKEIWDLIRRLPPGERPIPRGVYLNFPETEH